MCLTWVYRIHVNIIRDLTRQMQTLVILKYSAAAAAASPCSFYFPYLLFFPHLFQFFFPHLFQ